MIEDLVSIITPAYNAEKTVRSTIESVLNQTYQNWEMLIVDDCSVDSTKNIIREYENLDSRVKLISLEKNSGIANARNTAINEARGRYIAFLDSDDLWKVNKLAMQIEFMIKNNLPFTFTEYELMNVQGELIGKRVAIPKHLNYLKLLQHNQIACLTVVIKSEIIKMFKMPQMKHEDYATWLNILKSGVDAYGLKENLAFYRLSPTSVSANKLQGLTWTWNIYRKNQGFGVVVSSLLLVIFVIKNLGKYLRLGLIINIFWVMTKQKKKSEDI